MGKNKSKIHRLKFNGVLYHWNISRDEDSKKEMLSIMDDNDSMCLSCTLEKTDDNKEVLAIVIEKSNMLDNGVYNHDDLGLDDLNSSYVVSRILKWYSMN